MNVIWAKVIPVIEIKTKRGDGSTDNPGRTVLEYWSFDGKKLAENDSYFDSISSASLKANSESRK